MTTAPFQPDRWRVVEGFDFTDITYHRHVVDGHDHGTVRIAFNRPEVRNAFRPHTVDELYRALDHARMTPDVGCVLLTGNGPSPKDGGWAFCSGGDQRVRGRDGYRYTVADSQPDDAGRSGDDERGTGHHERIDPARAGRLHILEVQRLIRIMPKVVIAVVPGWAAGGGHSLHVVCDLTLASAEHARFKQTDADVGSFDAGYGSAYLARQVGQKFAREIFFLGDEYSADEAFRMGMVNAAVPHADLENVALKWATKINGKSPTAQRMLKFAFNAVDDGLVGQQVFAGEATRLAYMTDEAAEGRDAFLDKRDPDWSRFPWYY
ncbi:1,4-dihydroxy-2-naphthoyl-CoA synthase [Phytoactinopolyspora limicola]|uniref:1,4-dihydroxy-2-naphthoyl-CoA synthase n=1 Tax=Phytoactinopolyspora limicola TaxID=2715536 RepID=UPI00140872BE|nr:1,4-dihydroxy-2-naphthoyl-CoA synthase [Phytoactinopolyspora limicola]